MTCVPRALEPREQGQSTLSPTLLAHAIPTDVTMSELQRRWRGGR